jgi:predicted Zn-dependent peptidase
LTPLSGKWLFAALLAASVPAAAIDHRGEGRKTTQRDLSVELTRYELPNGLVVLLSPDPSVSSVMVEITFRAGTLHEPPGRSGMAHLIEHVMASGPTPETDYVGLLERRRARYFNASTDAETMGFQTLVPAEELPLALWVAADRLGSLRPLIDDPLVERNRRVVLQERNLRDVDAPYGIPRERLFAKLFAAPHPLHGSVIGTVEELASVNAADVRAFVTTLLVPANGILTVVGRFEPAQARALIEQNLGRLPAGKRARIPAFASLQQGTMLSADEVVSREPAVAIAWRFPIPHDEAVALGLGAQLLSFMTDGAWGMRLGAHLDEGEAESTFQVALTVPWDEPASVVQSDVEGFLRLLTRKQMPLDLVEAANVVLDRIALFDLETLAGRARRLTRLERLFHNRISVGSDCSAHWLLDPSEIRNMAQSFLDGPKVVLHARPTRPRPARAGRR